MPDRFFCPSIPDIDDVFRLTGGEVHHLRTVLRGEVGIGIEVIDGKGTKALCRVESIRRREADLRVIERMNYPDDRGRVDVAFSLPRKESSADLIIRYLTAGNVSRGFPVISHRSIRKSTEHLNMRMQRWERIVVSVCKQCGRVWFPEIAAPMTLKMCLEKLGCHYGMLIAGWEPGLGDAVSISDINKDHSDKPVLWIVGPEGGWAASDLKLLRSAGVIPLRLGRLIWTEPTAVFAGVIALRCRLNNL